jgi:hypothetical protein
LSPFHGDGFGEEDQSPWRTIDCELSESVDELVEEGNPFEADVVTGVEHADN